MVLNRWKPGWYIVGDARYPCHYTEASLGMSDVIYIKDGKLRAEQFVSNSLIFNRQVQ